MYRTTAFIYKRSGISGSLLLSRDVWSIIAGELSVAGVELGLHDALPLGALEQT